MLTTPDNLFSSTCLLMTRNYCSGGSISDFLLRETRTVVLLLCKDYFVMLKKRWMFDMVQLLKIVLHFI